MFESVDPQTDGHRLDSHPVRYKLGDFGSVEQKTKETMAMDYQTIWTRSLMIIN